MAGSLGRWCWAQASRSPPGPHLYYPSFPDYLTWTLVQFSSTLVQQVHFGGFHLVPPGSSNSYNITAPDATNNSTKAPPPLGVEGQSTEISPDLATDLFPHFVDSEKKGKHCDIRTFWTLSTKYYNEMKSWKYMYDSDVDSSVIYLGAENKLHTCKSVNLRKTSIVGSNNNFDIISTPSHKSINLERNSISYKNLKLWR